MNAIQLCTLTCYERGVSTITIDNYVKRAKSLNYTHLGVSDSTFRAFPEFTDACKKYDIKPIYGLKIKLLTNIRINENIKDDFRCVEAYLYIKNENGYRNLCLLQSLDKKTYSIDDIKKYKDGLILVLSTDNSDFFENDFYSRDNLASTIKNCREVFKDDFYFGITISENKSDEEKNVLYSYLETSGINAIAFPKVNYLYKSDAKYLQILQYGIEGKEIQERIESGPNFLIAPNLLSKIYREKDLNNLSEMVNKIDFNFYENRGSLIKIEDDKDILRMYSYTGLKEKLKSEVSGVYKERLDYELDMIDKLNFSSYFLLVKDYVDFAKRNDIKVGPGRGSAAGSLVTYSLDITLLDPIKYNLSFERFLNPKRKTMPDIDIDFDDKKRDQIISYLQSKYGRKKVVRMITYQRLRPKSALKIVAIAEGVSDSRIKKLTSCFYTDPDDFTSIYNDKNNIRLQEMLKDPYYRDLCNKAEHLLTIPLNTSFHAPGVIINSDDVYLSVPLSEGKEGIAQYEYPYLEKMGYLKMDILSLSNLSFVDKIEKRIKQKHHLENLIDNLNDEQTYKTLNNLSLALIFQLNTSYGMRDAIKKVKPTTFKDLAALLALYRPGPKDYIDQFARRKNGVEKIVYKDKRLEPILKETYGIFLYQEQIMQAVCSLANFKADDADLFRRAISKKKIEEMEKYKDRFILGCKDNQIDDKVALSIFDDIEKFASYGFNKSHGYSYAYISYQLLYYKTHYREEFYKQAFNDCKFNTADGQSLLKELQSLNYSIKNPDINISDICDIKFADNNIYLPLLSASPCDIDLIEKIVKEREKGSFKSIYSFCLRVQQFINKQNRNTLTSLMDCGGFDSLCSNREQLGKNMDQYLDFASMEFSEDQIPKMENTKKSFTLLCIKEKLSLGFINTYKLYDTNFEKELIVTDTSQQLMEQIITAENSTSVYKIKLKGNIKFEKYDLIRVKAVFKYGKIYIEPESITKVIKNV